MIYEEKHPSKKEKELPVVINPPDYPTNSRIVKKRKHYCFRKNCSKNYEGRESFRKIKRTHKYNSYQGEITPTVENVINRDFSAEKPNTKWLTDISEFAITAGKVYLSPIVDCFDGLLVTWNIGTSPDATLVNTMLDNAIKKLPSESKPIIHSDRGVHYRWP